MRKGDLIFIDFLFPCWRIPKVNPHGSPIHTNLEISMHLQGFCLLRDTHKDKVWTFVLALNVCVCLYPLILHNVNPTVWLCVTLNLSVWPCVHNTHKNPERCIYKGGHFLYTLKEIQEKKEERIIVSYLSDKNHLRNQEDTEAGWRLAKKVGVATKKHNGNKGLARTSL